MTVISMDKNFESFGPAPQEAERKIENVETMMDGNNINLN